MIWSLLVIVVLAVGLLLREIRQITADRYHQRLLEVWPQFEETYISALQSGMSVNDAFSFTSDFNIPIVSKKLNTLIGQLDSGLRLDQALSNFGHSLGLGCSDMFVAILRVANQFGGSGLIEALQEHVAGVRFELGARNDVQARQNAILYVAKLGLLAPWVLLAVLCINADTRTSFETLFGNLILLAGFAISLLAYRLVVAAGRKKDFARVYGS